MTNKKKIVCASVILPLTIGIVIGLSLFPSLASVVVRAAEGKLPQSKARELPVVRARINAALNCVSLANDAWQRKDYSDGETLFNRAIELSPGNPLIKMAFAQMLAEEGKAKEAFAYDHDAIHPDANRFYQSGFSDPLTLSKYAELAHAAGEQSEADWAARQIVLTASQSYPEFPTYTEENIDSAPIVPLANLAVGLAQERVGDSKKALATFQSVVAGNPRLALAHLYVAQQYEHMVGVGYAPERAEYAKAARLGDVRVRAVVQERLKQLRPSYVPEAHTKGATTESTLSPRSPQ